jgi:predicted porin
VTLTLRSALPALAMALPTLVSAQGAGPTGVTIYGVIDTGVEYLTDVGPGGKSVIRMPTNTAYSSSRLGLRGSEDLGGGLRALFTLEGQFGVDTGVSLNGGRLWGRQAWVGLSGPWGTLSMGRQNTMLFWSLLDATIVGPNAYGGGSLDSYLPNSRADNVIAYRGTFSGLTLGATFSPGRDSVNAGPSPAGTNCAGENAADKSACREWSVLLKYDTPTWGVAAATDHLKGGTGAFGGLTSSDLTDKRSLVNGWAKFGDWKFGAGFLRRDNEGNPVTPKSDLYFVGASWTATPAVVLDAEAVKLNYKSSANAATLLALRATYNFSRRSAAFLSAGHIGNDGSLALSVSGAAPGPASLPVPGGSQTGVLAGIRHAF